MAEPSRTRDIENLRTVLQDAVIKCSERCLYQSSKWAAELLASLPDIDVLSPHDTEIASPMSNVEFGSKSVPTGVISQNADPKENRLEASEVAKYLLAKSYFDCREYDRCAAVFLPMTLPRGQLDGQFGSQGKSDPKSEPPLADTENASMVTGFPNLSSKALFLALYAKYMSGEKRKDEESETILGPQDGSITINRELVGIARVLEGRFALQQRREDAGQGWLEYLYGIVMAKQKSDERARMYLTTSVHLYPFNWGAWQELASLIGSDDELRALIPELPQNIMTYIFHVYAKQELYQVGEDVTAALKKLKSVFPSSAFLRSQKALLCYHAKDFDRAEHIFAKLVTRDPLRLDNLDTYSNILYVMDKRPKLSYLAQLATATDKFRPETCVVVGNYYGLRSEHEKAIAYFRRALVLDRQFLSAWTLMGHEYVELKNTQAAIECYRRAVDVNRKDYRAWYGLGQTYEVLDMGFYALWYYQRAAALSPYDPKMWIAVGSCLEKMGRFAQAVKGYKRALLAGTYYENNAGEARGAGAGAVSFKSATEGGAALMDPEILYRIASMYDKLGDEVETKRYLELCLLQEEGGGDLEDADPNVNPNVEAGAAPAQGGTKDAQPSTPAGPSNPKASPSAAAAAAAAAVAAANHPPGSAQKLAMGVGVTATTSRARMWLAKIEYMSGEAQGLQRAMVLANELVQDGWEVEEAKALQREVRGVWAAEGIGGNAMESEEEDV